MKKYITLSLLLILGTLSLTGCEEKEAYDPTKDVNNPKNQEILEIWTDAHKNFFQAVGQEFVVTIKRTNLKVKVLEFPNSDTLKHFLLESMAEGNGPDIIYISGEWITQNHNKLIPREGDETFMPLDFEKTFVRSANETLIDGEKIYGVPMGIDSLALFYNNEHILDRLSDRNVPGKTWKEIQEDAENLSTPDNSFSRFSSSGIAMGRFDNLRYGFEILSNMILQFGGSFFTADGLAPQFYQQKTTVDGKTVSVGVEAVNLFTSFADPRFKYYSWSEFLAHPQSEYKDLEAFLRGDVSMVFGYAKDIKIMEIVVNKLSKSRQPVISLNNVRVTFFPQVVNPSLGGTRKILAKVYALTIPRSASNPELAWDFLKFVITQGNLQTFFQESNLPTPRVDMLKEQEGHPKLGIFVRQAKFARTMHFPNSVSTPNLIAAFSKIILAINNGKSTAERGLKNLESQILKEIQRYLKIKKQIQPKKEASKLLVE